MGLAWTPPAAVTGATVTGYNVYRQNADGTWRRLNSDLVTVASYTDTTVVASSTYAYRVTAVSDQNSQSAPTAVSATTPAGAPVVQIVSPAAYTGVSVNWASTGSTTVDGRINKLMAVK